MRPICAPTCALCLSAAERVLDLADPAAAAPTTRGVYCFHELSPMFGKELAGPLLVGRCARWQPFDVVQQGIWHSRKAP